MNFFRIIWMKLTALFREANLKPLDPVVVTITEDGEVLGLSDEAVEVLANQSAKLLEDIDKAKAAVPKMEVIQLDAVVASIAQPGPKVKPTTRRQLTKNFHIDEFATNDGTPVPPDLYINVLELAENLQELRDLLGKPIKVVSGYRHPAYNRKIGGAKKSQHMTAKAADIRVKGIGPARLAKIIEQAIFEGVMEKGGVGRYPNFTHYDIRGKNARWNGTRKKS